jgi:lauroyl/myristoyl acyltransferase
MCSGIGWLIATYPSPRRRVIFANIYRCVPHLSPDQIRDIAKDSCTRTVEMALFVLASPYISQNELKSRIILSDYLKDELEKRKDTPQPMLLLIPHFCMMESITLLPMLSETPIPKTGVFYRPFNNYGMEEWIRHTREKYGINLLSRKDGLTVSLDYLRANGCVAVLFDQNANASGTLTMFFDRICANSEIAGVLAEHTKCGTAIFYARRTGFWRAEISGEYFEAKTKEELIFKSNDWLENTLKTDPELCRDWLWLHKRWKVNDNPASRLTVCHRNMILDEYIKFKGYDAVPRKTEFIVRAPHALDEILEFIPAFKALYNSRYDARYTIMADARHTDFLRLLNIAENVIEAPAPSDKKRLKKLRNSYFTTQVMFADTPQDDRQARAILADLAFGIQTDRKRKGIKHIFTPTEEDRKLPKHLLYEKFLNSFGMNKPLDFSALKIKSKSYDDLIGVCIDETFEISQWRVILNEIVKFIPTVKFAFFHTTPSNALAAELANIYASCTESSFNVSDSLKSAAVKMSQCRCATGSNPILIRLANALGIPCVSMVQTPLLYMAARMFVDFDKSNTTPSAIREFAQTAATEISLID